MLHQGKLENTPHCPHCKKTIDGFTSMQGQSSPSNGDVSVCCYCKTVLEMEDGKWIFVTADTLEEIDLPVLQQANRAVAALKLWEK